MQEWELPELLVVEGYKIVVGAKPLLVVDETFCSVLTDDANCRYLDQLTFGASEASYKPIRKNKFDDDVSVASPMLKSAK